MHPSSAWEWMATREGAHITAFSHCLFRMDYSYALDIYRRFFNSAALDKLVDWMREKGYKPFDIYHLIGTDCKLSLSYVNPKWGNTPPRGGFEYKIKHTGISFRYDNGVQIPWVLGVCIPGGMKPYLSRFDSMEDSLRDFVISRNRKCNGCRYCVQTDKTGARPLAAVTVVQKGKQYSLCPYFPGGFYSWTSIDEEAADQIIALLDFMDGFAPGAAK